MSAQSGTTYGDRFIFTQTGQVFSAGTGSPEGVVTGSVGDLYARKDGGAAAPQAPLYFKATGYNSTTGWVALATTTVGDTTATISIDEFYATTHVDDVDRAGKTLDELVALGVVDAVDRAGEGIDEDYAVRVVETVTVATV